MEPSVLFKQRNGLSATEVSVLMRACVRRWAYEHAACVCVLPLLQPRQVNSSTTPAPMQTCTEADRNVFYWPTRHLKARLADTCTGSFHKSQSVVNVRVAQNHIQHFSAALFPHPRYVSSLAVLGDQWADPQPHGGNSAPQRTEP